MWLSRLRFVQAFGLSLCSLGSLGLAVLLSPAGQQSNTLSFAAGQVPKLTVLLAGRDIVYCYYQQPCKDQNQREHVMQPPQTDTLMLVRLNEGGVSILNIPRDTNVGDYNPNKSPAQQKVNSQYHVGGPEALTQAVETIIGERVDSYVIVRSDYVARVIDALGGLDVTVPPSGIEWVDKAAGVNLKLTPGSHHLAGQEAVLYLRVRKGVGDDYGRIDHQKQALTQLFAKLKSSQGLTALPTILGGIGNGVETNLDPNILPALLPYLTKLKLQSATLPTTELPGTFNLMVDREKLAQLWNTASDETTTERQNIRLSIYDASGEALGPRLAYALRQMGYPEVEVETREASEATSQVFTQQQVQAANQLASLLGFPRLQGERFPVRPRGVGILLGRDAVQSLSALKQAYPDLNKLPSPKD